MENVCKHYGHVKRIDIARAASELINHPAIDGSERYTEIAFGTIKYLQCHSDKDFTCSMVTLLKFEPYRS